MMDALLNSSMEIEIQERDLYQSDDDEHIDSMPSAGQRLFEFGKKTRHHDLGASLAENPLYKSKLSRLCTATIDPNGKCLEARGLLKNILDAPN